jgi:hypothetical protein
MAAARPTPIVCDVGALPPDALAVEALARLQLNAKRAGLELHLCGASTDLRSLLSFCGLLEALPFAPAPADEKV